MSRAKKTPKIEHGPYYDTRVERLAAGQVVRCFFDDAAGVERTIEALTEIDRTGRPYSSGRGVRLAPMPPCPHCKQRVKAVTGWIDAAWVVGDRSPMEPRS